MEKLEIIIGTEPKQLDGTLDGDNGKLIHGQLFNHPILELLEPVNQGRVITKIAGKRYKMTELLPDGTFTLIADFDVPNPDYREVRILASATEKFAKLKAQYEADGWKLETSFHSPNYRLGYEELVLAFRRINPSK